MKRSLPFFRSPIWLVILFVLTPVHAVIFYSTGDPTYNTSAPGGALADSGWQFEGIWGGFLGTPIAPKHFITARHIGGSVGDLFTINGGQFATTAVYDDPDSDLRIWRICGTFSAYAQIYTNSDETNKSIVVIGRGTQRAEAVTTTNLLGLVTNGWRWGPYDGVVRWGENEVAAIANGDGLFGSGIGDLLEGRFDADVGSNECHLSIGDSGGAVFIRDGSIWKLAGINYAVDGPFNTGSSGPGFFGAIFDERGLYTTNSVAGGWVQVPNVGPAQPSSFYATRVSAHAAWINSVLNGAGPGPDTPTLQSSSDASGLYTDDVNGLVDAASRTVTIALPGGSRFYRLRACDPVKIESIQVGDSQLVLRYQ